MADNKTDYTKPRTDLLKLLPEPLQSDVNLSLFDNIFNRYLTKQEIEKVAGYIGRGNPNALRSRQIHEQDVHRQAYQLQPIPYNKIGSVEHMTSWKDMQNELGRLGVDMSKFSEWGATQKFNWVPPIDINKIINYRDYYWVDSDNPNSIPQYITIRNTCATATAKLNFWESLIEQYGSIFAIDAILPSDATPVTYSITDFSTGPDLVKIEGDATTDILVGDFIDISSTSNNGTYKVTTNPSYSGVTNETTLDVYSTIIAGTPIQSDIVSLRRFDKLVLPATTELVGSPPVLVSGQGNYTGLFTKGFTFFIRNSTNSDLNNAIVETVSSTYDAITKETTVVINFRVTDNTTDGEVSLEEQLSIFEVDMKCQCGNFGGWDISLWDDNPLEPLWGDDEDAAGNQVPDGISDHTNLITRISNPTPPVSGVGVVGELWYDTVDNILYQAAGSPISWTVIWRNFSLLLEQTTGLDLWDLSLSCDTRPRITATEQWINQNHWFHKNDVDNFTSVQRANQPIIEYDWDLELNEWTHINYNWSYRSDEEVAFEATTKKPVRIELEKLVWWEHQAITGNEIIFDDRYGDMTDYFVEGKEVFFVDDLLKTVYIVETSSYKTLPSANPYRTYVTFTERPPESGSPANLFNLLSNQPNTISVEPVRTVEDDIWGGYGIHWLFVNADDSVPTPHQSVNPYIDIDDTQTPIAAYGTGSPIEVDYTLTAGSPPTNTLVFDYTTSLQAQNFLLNIDYSTFMLLDNIPTTTTRGFTRKALYGYDDIRVYVADLVGDNVAREFGTYDEIGEVVFDIVGVDFVNSEFRINTTNLNFDPSPYFASGSPADTIRISNNSGAASTTYTVVPGASTLNRIKVQGLIDPNTTITGTISNVTSPILPDDGIGFTFTNSKNVTVYVTGITFFTPRPTGTNVRVIVGEAATDEIGTGIVGVRMEESNDAYPVVGDIPISTTGYRIVEQIKTKTNQYPLFDIFAVAGNPAYTTNSIFGYRTSGDATINQAVGLRIVHDAVNDVYEFDQFLLNEDNGELFAYRDYANKQNDYWYNPETNELKFWDGINWNDKTAMSEFYRRAIVSPVEPTATESNINGLYWYNTTTDTLFRRFIGAPSAWIEVHGVDQLITDANLQTIWKAGKNADLYIPAEVDWRRRSEVEYNSEKNEFITNRVLEILATDNTITEAEAIIQATNEWHESQTNHISLNGTWVGDWEIPDPLYYNNLHENRKYLDSTELLTHFTTIINEQEPIPGWSGTKAGQFNIVHLNDINYGLGGTIKEFNNGFDTLMSSVMVNNVTPRSLIEFAHDQYEGLLNVIKEIYRKNSIDTLSDVSVDAILNVSSIMADEIIALYELNDNTAFLYGDSTTFTDNNGVSDLGVRNWIATLPYLNLVHRFTPERTLDADRGLNEVVHHDGHRNSYEISPATSGVISTTLINTPDPRNPTETLGIESTTLPANNITEFEAEFNTISSRSGVYWYYTTSSPRKLYRYVVAASGTQKPDDSLPDGTLWMDLMSGLETLRVKRTDGVGTTLWSVVDGLSIGDGRLHNGTDPNDFRTATTSAWQLMDLDVILSDVIFELENRLYENAPVDVTTLNYDFATTRESNPIAYLQSLEEAFLSYVSQREIVEPFNNINFDTTAPFTWNYKSSTSGAATNIFEADDLTNSFVVIGDKTSLFTSGLTFYVNNSITNNGTWETISTVYDIGNNITTIFVTGDVNVGIRGSIYSGILPSPITTSNPNNLNDGSESGGDWRDLYEKIYGTPYPHLEPWILQGYTSKPDYWDSTYKNDDAHIWGDRTWKYKHGFDIVAASTADNTFAVQHEFVEVFVSSTIGSPPISFVVDNSPTHQGNYIIEALNIIQSVVPGPAGIASFVLDNTTPPLFASSTFKPGMKIGIVDVNDTLTQTYIIKSVALVGSNYTIVVEEEILVGDITPGTDFINGAVYSPTSDTTTIYVDVVSTSAPVDGRIAIRHGMWQNILIGQIPPGATYPNGVVSITGIPADDNLTYGLSTIPLPTFNYFSVNVDNVVVSSDGGTTNFSPDAILPPYWDHTEVYGTVVATSIDTIVRSLYFNFGAEIVAPNVNYTFNDSGPVEWEWKSSSQYLYDQLVCSYTIDPANFIYNTFGFNFTTIGGLLIDRDTKNTASHTRTNFHGDVVNNTQFKSDGLNQWYANFNRYDGYDTNFSDFQSLWTLWTAPLMYQFASYVDTPSLSISHRYIDLTNFDYNITSKRSAGIEDFWLDAFKVQILNIPYDLSRYNNQVDWRFDVRTNISQSRSIEYYDVHNYQYYPNTTTNECTLYTWKIITTDTFDNEFSIKADHADIFVHGREIVVSDSSGNNGTYTIEFSSYDTVTNLTTVSVTSPVLSPTPDGIITITYRNIPWETGAPVYLSTTESMPIPLDTDTVIGTTKYFIIKISDSTFKIANTLSDAHAGIEIPLTTVGIGDQYVGELLSTFVVAAAGDVLWRQYAIDETNKLSWSTPKQIQGMQRMVDIVRGYEAFTKNNGWTINSDKSLRDPDTNTIISWQVEIERLIDYSYSTRVRRTAINDRYPVTVDYATDEFTFNSTNNIFITGDPVVVVSSTSILPSPLIRNVTYYVIRDTLNNFQLATSSPDAEQGINIDILPTTGVGDLALSIPIVGKFLIPAFEMNPFRNAVWFNQPSGIVSNIITGPVEDIRTSQLIFDQNGNTIETDALRVYRRDTETKIIVNDAVNTQPELTFVGSDYNFLHLGGLHIFTDSYEHALIFNNYSTDDNLLYDPFIGLNVTKYEMLFNRNPEFTGRPNVGGYYLETFFNQGANIKENFEAGVENLRKAYDTYDTLESNVMTTTSRASLGYEGTKDYLTNLNVSEKSQFIFWRGQIQAKGSVNAIKAYINSRRFIDAKVDEFWAIKVADFGSVGEKEYPEIFATTVDARTNEFKIEFIDNADAGLNVTEGFTPIKMSDTERWYNQPEQIEILRNNGKIMYFDMKILSKIDGTPVGSPATSPIIIEANNYIVHNMNVDAVTMTIAGTDFTDFEYINPYIVKLTGSPLPNANDLVMYGYVANNDAQNPSRLIDRDSEVQLSTIEFWDPARGNHYSNAIHNVDLQNYNDPAIYISTPQPITATRVWTSEFVGTSWMDTSTMDYVPYHSDKVITDNIIRFREWGQLYDYASINIYEWVESDISPESWDGVAASETGDNTIPEDQRKSGIAKFTLFEPDGSGSPVVWQPLKNKIDTQFAARNLSGTFTIDLSIIDNTKPIDVYINESYQSSIQPIGSPAILPITTLLTIKENDVVKFVQAVPTDTEEIAAGIAAGTLLQQYEYTTVDEYDALGRISTKYYFWVGNKSTKPLDRNRLMSLAEAEQQLVNVPSAHMFYQKPLSGTTNSETGNLVSRIEFFTPSVDGIGSPIQHQYNIVLPAAQNTPVVVDIDGVDIDSGDITITTSTSPVVTTVTIAQPVAGGSPEQRVKISYTGVYDKNVLLPERFSQVIVRGLQGIVFDDSRYTIRFTRDFTLRDNLNIVNGELAPLELNNLHEEWKIFRKEQDAKIDRWMWDKVIESMIGYTLADSSIRVPSFEYELYDDKFETDTQYGLDTNQTFVNGVLALSSTIAYLIDPDVSFAPIDINIFFSNYNFDTPEDIILSMNAIYNTFTVSNVNRIYFSILHDAFTTKTKYPGIFKTSMVSLHGIRPFQSAGVFDD